MAEASKGGALCTGKSASASREEAGAPRERKGAGKRKEAEEDRRREGGVPCKGRSAARIEEELNGRAKKESRGILWKGCPRRGTIPRIRVVHPGNDSDVHQVQRM